MNGIGVRSDRVDREFIEKLLRDIDEAISIISSDTSKPFEDLSRSEKSEIRYYLIVLAESLIVLSYHIARNMYGLEPTTPSESFRALAERGLIKNKELYDLIGLIRLRNILVHRYWVIDDRRLYENVRKDFSSVKRFVERIRIALRI